jgi:hypothetical protein
MGRFIVWTKSAFEALDTIYGALPGLQSQHVPTTSLGDDCNLPVNSDLEPCFV